VKDAVPASDVHCVHFFEPSRFPASEIATFLYEGLNHGESAVVMASSQHASQMELELAKRGLNIPRLTGAGLWVVTEVAELMRALQSDATVAMIIESYIELVIRPAQAQSDKQRVRIYGELEDAILSQLRNAEMALEVERYGNQLVAEGATKIYCGYSTNAFPDASFARPFIRLCRLHDQVHNGLSDRNDWRFQMAKKMASA
jgi:hypothetical protein